MWCVQLCPLRDMMEVSVFRVATKWKPTSTASTLQRPSVPLARSKSAIRQVRCGWCFPLVPVSPRDHTMKVPESEDGLLRFSLQCFPAECQRVCRICAGIILRGLHKSAFAIWQHFKQENACGILHISASQLSSFGSKQESIVQRPVSRVVPAAMTQTLPQVPQATVEKMPLSPSRLSRSSSAKVIQESLSCSNARTHNQHVDATCVMMRLWPSHVGSACS